MKPVHVAGTLRRIFARFPAVPKTQPAVSYSTFSTTTSRMIENPCRPSDLPAG